MNKAFVFPVPQAVYSNLANGDRLSIVDARGKERYIKISTATENNQITGHCDKTIHLITGSQVVWQRYTEVPSRTILINLVTG